MIKAFVGCVSALFLTSPVGATQTKSCETSLMTAAEEREALRIFKVDDAGFLNHGVTRYSPTVYRLVGADHKAWIVRIPSLPEDPQTTRDDIYREAFLADVFNNIPGVRVRWTRVLPTGESDFLREIIVNDLQVPRAPDDDRFDHPGFEALRRSGPVSVGVFHRGIEGSDFLEPYIPDGDTFELSWLSRIPRSVVGQLADLWVLYLVFGYQDFHSGNWLASNEEVLGIDMALDPALSPVSQGGSYHKVENPLMYLTYHWPFDFVTAPPKASIEMFRNVRGPVRLFLGGLDEAWLRAEASQRGYAFKPGDLADILARAALAQAILAEFPAPR